MGYSMPISSEDFYKTYFNIETPYQFQNEVWNKINQSQLPLLIKAPSGSGKTEAVLAPFLKQFIDRDFSIAPRLIYVLPMRVLAKKCNIKTNDTSNKRTR